jgi:hypothetical protein
VISFSVIYETAKVFDFTGFYTDLLKWTGLRIMSGPMKRTILRGIVLWIPSPTVIMKTSCWARVREVQDWYLIRFKIEKERKVLAGAQILIHLVP